MGTASTGWLSIGDWRGLLGVEDGCYPTYKSLRQHVLAPSVRQVNEVGHIQVEMETQKKGRRTSALRFLVRPGVPALVPVEAGSEGEGDADRGEGLVERLHAFGLTDGQIEKAAALPSEQVERNLAHVEGDLARGTKIGKLGAYTYRAVVEDWAGAQEAAEQTQADLFDAPGGGDGTSEPAARPSAVAVREAARRSEQEAADRALDDEIDGLDAEARRALDAEAVQYLRAERNPYWGEIERALGEEPQGQLSPAKVGALRMARREAMRSRLGEG